MRLTDIFRRLVSHFIPSSSRPAPETKEAKPQQQPQQPSRAYQSPTSSTSSTSSNKPSTTINNSTATRSTMPGVTSTVPAGTSKYDQIPGPLGLASASLQGKVALVTGAGTLQPEFLDFSIFLDFLCAATARVLQRLDWDLHACTRAVRRCKVPGGRVGSFTPTQRPTRGPDSGTPPHAPRPLPRRLRQACLVGRPAALILPAGLLPA